MIMQYADTYKSKYACSVVFAVISVVCGMIPYFAVAKMVTAIMSDSDKMMSFYVKWCAAAAAGYVCKGIFNGISTSISHTATYLTMKEIRLKLIAKLIRMPMGAITNSPSGHYKDVIVDRVEGIEVPLAHLLPEMTANVLAPVLMLICLFILDWRLALISLITIPVGMAVMSTTMKSYGENYGKSVEIGGRMTNAIVEYMGGIAKLVRGKTVIVIAHRLSTITDADNIIVMDNGTVAAHGRHDELLENSQLYRSMWQAHTGTKGGAEQ